MKHYKLRPYSAAWYAVQTAEIVLLIAAWYIMFVLVSAM